MTQRSQTMVDKPGERAVIIEFRGEPVGLLLAEGRGVVFFACAPDARSLDKRWFSDPRQAEREIDKLLSSRRGGISSRS